MDYLRAHNAGASEGEVLTIISPRDGKPVKHPETGVVLTITLLSRDHPDVRSLWRKKLNEIIRAQGEGTDADSDDADMDVLAAATVSWTLHETKCTKSNVKKVYRENIWIREQVERFYTNRANFLPALSSG